MEPEAMDVLYLSHCVPDAPDKGEKIRAFHWAREMMNHHRVHLVCFGRTDAEVAAARAMSGFASVYAEKISAAALPKAAWAFLRGGCLVTRYFRSEAMRRHVAELCGRVHLHAAVAYTTAMAGYAPRGVPLLLDMADVDSEKWLQYADMRRPSLLYAAVGRRLRDQEIARAESAVRTILITEPERRLLERVAPLSSTVAIENGVDFSRFERPEEVAPELKGRRFLAFVGAMNYYPNVQGVTWFADEVWGELRRRVPGLEFGIIGREPSRAVRSLASRPGIWVAANPPSVAPFLAASAAAVAPLQLARGIQNKVLEGLAMGKSVFSSAPVCRTFGDDLPPGVIRCGGALEFIDRIAGSPLVPGAWDPAIRQAAERRFAWSDAAGRLLAELAVVGDRAVGASL